MSASLRAARAAAQFLELIELPPDQRDEQLQVLQHSDPELHAELVQLLARFDGGLSVPPPGIATGPGGPLGADGRVGERLGPFELLAPLGRGGMGTVWRARRVDGQYQQEVAIKRLHLRPSADAAMQSLHARFLRERQTLASLKHPHIASLLDGGVDAAGQPWFALELVSGRPITRYAQDGGLDLRARLRLLLQVLDAVQFAHQRLVVHRDLKPDNLLVDDSGQVKLLDFGIVKLLDDTAPDADQTATGAHLFTPNYAAPEQVEGGDISVATDVYALGIILFELLVGRRPFQHGGMGLQMAQLGVDWRVEPPSRVLSRETAAAARNARQLRGDLDTIVLRCLAREPQRRYPTVQALADDLQRYLDGRPIRARPDSRGYRVAKFLRRHPYSSAAVLVGLVLLLALTAVSVVQARRAQVQTLLAQRFAEQARSERNAALAESHRLELLQEHYASVLTRALSSGAPIEPAALLEMAGNLDATVASNDRRARRSLELSQAELLLTRNDYAGATALLEALLPQRTELSPIERVDFLETLASVYLRLGRIDEVPPLLTEGDAVAATLASRKDGAQARLKVLRSQWLRTRGELKPAFQIAMSAVAQLRWAEDLSPLRHGQLLFNAAQSALAAGEIDTARTLTDDCLSRWDKAGLRTLVAHRNAGTLLANLDLLRGQPRLALANLEQMEASPHTEEPIPGAAARRSSQAKGLAYMGRYDEARALARKARQQFCEAVGAATPDCLKMSTIIVDVDVWASRPDTAAAMLAEIERTAAGAPLPPAIASVLPGYRSLIQLEQTPDAATVAALDAALAEVAAQGGLSVRNAMRQRLGAAERLLADGREALARVLVQPLLEATAAAPPAPESGMDAALLALWRARIAGDSAAAAPAWNALREQLGDDHPSVRRWKPAAQTSH